MSRDAIAIKVIKVEVQENGIIRLHEGRSENLLIGRLVDGIGYKSLERMEDVDEGTAFRELKENLKIYEDEIKKLKKQLRQLGSHMKLPDLKLEDFKNSYTVDGKYIGDRIE